MTFTRPAPKPTTTAPPASAGQAFNWGPGDPVAVVGRASFTPAEAKGLKVEVNSLHLDASGVATLVWTLRNDGGGPIGYALKLYRKLNSYYADLSGFGEAAGLELVDTTRGLNYQPLRSSADQCLCPRLAGGYNSKSKIWPGEAVTYANLYELPPEVRTVQLQIPWDASPGATVTGLPVS